MHHQFGSVAGDEEMGGTFGVGDAVFVNNWTTVAIKSLKPLVDQPVIALELIGRINKTHDTFQAVILLPVMDVGSLTAALYDAIKRLQSDEAMSDFKLGMMDGSESNDG